MMMAMMTAMMLMVIMMMVVMVVLMCVVDGGCVVFLLGWRAKIKMSIVVVVVVLFPVCLGWFLVHRARFRSIRAGLSCESDW